MQTRRIVGYRHRNAETAGKEVAGPLTIMLYTYTLKLANQEKLQLVHIYFVVLNTLLNMLSIHLLV